VEFIGVDLAWTARGGTGVCRVMMGKAAESELLRSDDEIIAWLGERCAGDALVAIDAPLIVRNRTGRRPCESLISRCFGGQHASAHSANLSLRAFSGGVRGEQIVASLGIGMDPYFPPCVPVRRAIEVYPHPAIVALFGLPVTLKYKAKSGRTLASRREALTELAEHLESLGDAEPPLDVTAAPRWHTLRRGAAAARSEAGLDKVEDELDAYVCAYTGLYYWTHGTSRCRVVGETDSGYIVTPVDERAAVCLDAASSASKPSATAEPAEPPPLPASAPPERLELRPAHALIAALREPPSETELTRALSAVFAVDPAMAAAFVRVAMRQAPHGERVDLRELPDALECRAEVTLAAGRADLSFTSNDRLWHVIIELKIHAGYGGNQISRYLESFHCESKRQVLAAVTRDVPTYGDDSDDPRWVGSIQWAKLLPELRALEPSDPLLGTQWLLFLDVLEMEGSMGFTRPNPSHFDAWAQFPAARDHLIDFVDAVRRPLLASLQHALGETYGPPEQRASFTTRGKVRRAVVPRLGKILVGFRIPSGGPERITAGVWGWGEPRFIVELPFPRGDAPEAAAAVAAVMEDGFESWRDRVLTRYLPLDHDLLAAPDLQERVVAFSAEAFGAIVRSDILALEPSAPPPEEDEETP
jgi:predicted RNase H-like nuclease